MIQNTTEDKIEILLKRGNTEIEVSIKPEIKINYYLGVYFKQADSNIKEEILHFLL